MAKKNKDELDKLFDRIQKIPYESPEYKEIKRALRELRGLLR